MSLALIGAVAATVAYAAEPNDDFITATGPLTAGQTFKASLETTNDVDFHFFYLPDTTQVSLTTINATKKRGGAADRGRTIVSSLLRARKGKLPLPAPDSAVTLAPGKRATVRITLLPGKYFIPVGRAASTAEPLPNADFRLRIGPIGSTTDSFEIFERRCLDAKRKLARIKSSTKRTAERLAKAQRNDAPAGKVRGLKAKLSSKRAKGDLARRAEKFACSIPA